jgi:hypothetical protein
MGGYFGTDLLLGAWNLGFEAAFSGGTTSATETYVADMQIRPTAFVQLTSGVTAGHSWLMGDWGVRGEMMVGMRLSVMDVVTRLGDCISESTSKDLSLMLEPRVSVERWLAPWASVGVRVGSDLMQERDLSIGVAFTAHSRAFDAL